MGFDRHEFAGIFAGGFVGAVGRAGLAQALPAGPGQWPWATFAVNVLRAFLLGYFTTRLRERLPVSPTVVRCSAPGSAAGSPPSRRCRWSC